MYRRKDAYYTRAKAEGYRSRSAFKLLELARQYRLIRPGDRVVDVGAWPGGWLQVAARQAGATGCVVGIDVRAIEPMPGVVTLVGDIAEPAVQVAARQSCGGTADVVLSDVAPQLSGIRVRDQAQAQALANTVLQFTRDILRPGGHLLIKLFTGSEVAQYVAQLRRVFHSVRTTRPEATRKGSAEIYAIACGFRRDDAAGE